MKPDLKKQRERAHLEWFRNACSGFPVGNIRETEEPDFVIETSDRNVGIEHTEFHQDDAGASGGSRLREQEALRSRVVSKALRLHESRFLPVVDVRLMWSGHHSLSARKVKQMSDGVANVVQAHMPDSGRTALIECPADGWELLPAEIASVRIARIDGMAQNCWWSIVGGYVQRIEPEDFAAVIARKEARAPIYRKLCDELWLVIVAPGFAESSLSELSPDARVHEFKTSFDRLFFLCSFDSDAVELRLRRADS